MSFVELAEQGRRDPASLAPLSATRSNNTLIIFATLRFAVLPVGAKKSRKGKNIQVMQGRRTLSEAPRRLTHSWFCYYPREARRRDRRHSLRSQDAPSARAGTRSKEFFPAPGGVNHHSARWGALAKPYTSKTKTNQRQRTPLRSNAHCATHQRRAQRFAQGGSAPSPRLLHFVSLDYAHSAKPAPCRSARSTPLRAPSCLRLASFI